MEGQEKVAETRDDDDSDNHAGTGGNSGTMIVDATCAPFNIRFSQDASLLNEVRENAEKLLDALHDPAEGKKPRCYRKCARKDYLKYTRYNPKLNADSGIYRFREVFWEKGYYADGTIGRIRHDIVCLCKVISIQKAVLSHERWDHPHLIVENVATHQQFDFAKIEQVVVLRTHTAENHDFLSSDQGSRS